MGSEVEQLVLVAEIGVNGLDGKLSVGERARLVEDHRLHLSQDIHVVGTLDEDTTTRGASDTSEEREGNTDNQRTRTTHHEEHQGAIKPSGEGSTQ